VNANAPETPLLLDIPEAARLIGMSSRWVWEEAHAGRLPVVELGRRRKIRRVDLLTFVEENLTPAPAHREGESNG
jgi:excisionase family DNA binding protein